MYEVIPQVTNKSSIEVSLIVLAIYNGLADAFDNVIQNLPSSFFHFSLFVFTIFFSLYINLFKNTKCEMQKSENTLIP